MLAFSPVRDADLPNGAAEPFLGIRRSLTGRLWLPRLASSRDALAIAEKHDLPEILGRVLAGRGVKLDEVEAYLTPTIRGLMPQPSAINDMEKGAERLADAIMAGEAIGIIADYDVDGVTSAALMRLFLRAAGTEAVVHIPDRLTEGYGPSEAAVRALKDKGVSLLLTLDCGVLAHDPLAHAAELGMTAIIVDHHLAGATLPEAHSVINPNREDDLSGFGYLCACGVAMILVAATNRALRRRGWYAGSRPEPNLLQWLELVAIATVCDVVPLKGLNRAYVTQGLKVMARRENPGLAALADAARLKRRPDPYALGFLLGPRLNAAGRIGSAGLALELLTSRDRATCGELAQKLENLNRDRQAIEMAVVDAAIAQAELALGREGRQPVIMVAGEDWHAGVLGLAASRLKERFNLPAIVLGHAKGAGVAAGSGRSISGVDLGNAVRAALDAGLILKGGGHAMAAGLTLDLARLADLRAFFEEKLAHALTLSGTRRLDFDGALSAGGASLDLIELLDQAGPYGAGNPSPLFALPAHRVLYADRAGNDHVRCTLAASDGSRIKAVAFRALGSDLGEMLLSERQHPLHLAGRLTVDDWNGGRTPCFHIEDIAEVA
jgi:single-stranded-DNA-specific exonuclease